MPLAAEKVRRSSLSRAQRVDPVHNIFLRRGDTAVFGAHCSTLQPHPQPVELMHPNQSRRPWLCLAERECYLARQGLDAHYPFERACDEVTLRKSLSGGT